MANVLETFYILFESDASKADKDVKKLSESLNKTAKSAKRATTFSEKAGKEFRNMGRSALGAVAGIFALGAIISGTMSKIAQQDELGKFSKSIGENIGEVDAWGKAVARNGGSADAFRQSIEGLNEKVVDASIKGMNEIVPFFNQLGVSIVDANGKARSTIELLPELADSFETLSRQESSGLGKKLGLDPGTIQLLQSGRKEVEAMVKSQKQFGVASKESAEVSRKFNKQMEELKQVMGFSSQTMLVSVLPAMTAVLDVFTNLGAWMNDNQSLVQGFFIGVGVAAFFAIPPILTLAASVWAIILPFLALAIPIAALGTAFALLFEDITAFANGQESLLGKMIEKWPLFGKVVGSVVSQVKDAVNILKELALFLADVFFFPQRALEKMTAFISGIGGQIKDAAKFLFGIGVGDDDIVVNAKKTLELASNSDIGSQTPGSIQNSSSVRSKNTSVQTGDIVIQTQATDSEGIAVDVAGSLNRQLRTAVDNFDDGVVI